MAAFRGGSSTTGGDDLVQRMIGAARLNPATYEEIEHDQSATPQAAIVVVLAAIAGGIGALDDGGAGLIAGLIGSVLGWVISAAVVYVIGTKLLAGPHTNSSIGELLRTIGFASVPGILAVLGFIPVVEIIIGLIVVVWSIATYFVAVRQALDV